MKPFAFERTGCSATFAGLTATVMTFVEKALLPLSRRHPALHEFLWFGLKQA